MKKPDRYIRRIGQRYIMWMPSYRLVREEEDYYVVAYCGTTKLCSKLLYEVSHAEA